MVTAWNKYVSAWCTFHELLCRFEANRPVYNHIHILLICLPSKLKRRPDMDCYARRRRIYALQDKGWHGHRLE